MDETFKQLFLSRLRHHLAGCRAKVEKDFSEAEFAKELDGLRADPVYPKFCLATPEYVLVRRMGRVSISIGRRLGDLYDKAAGDMAQRRFGLKRDEVTPKIGGELRLDVCIPLGSLSESDVVHVHEVCEKHSVPSLASSRGLGIEIRYNFNPNDSSRLQKDVRMASLLRKSHLVPIYLIFAENSPRDEAIQRLQRAGWHFLVGRPALAFISEMLGTDVTDVLEVPEVAEMIRNAMDAIMAHVFGFTADKMQARELGRTGT